ncbi:beta-1,4-glucuronyltransferase 1 [Cherax quadricarinatus]
MPHRRRVTQCSLVFNIVLVLYITTVYVTYKVYKCRPILHQGICSEHSPSMVVTVNDTMEEDSVLKKMYSDISECANSVVRPSSYQRGHYWVLENYLPAAYTFPCNNTITYTTHADYTFLNNLVPLTARWQGPVSAAVYAPGTDFERAVDTIMYLRDCISDDIKNHVTFHMIFDVSHTPEVPPAEEVLTRKSECSQQVNLSSVSTYRYQQGLLYPVNVARNTARLAAKTYFVLPSDIELYPSINFIPDFFEMMEKKDWSSTTKPRVYVLLSYDIKNNSSLPSTKNDLRHLVLTGEAHPLYIPSSSTSHTNYFPQDWINRPGNSDMSVIQVGEIGSQYSRWEPVYVGTNAEPLYDERLYWEGKKDRMIQMYALCLSDYELHILDTAFMVRPPGHQQEVVSSSCYQQEVVSSPGHQQEVVSSPGHQQEVVSSPGHQLEMVSSPGHQQEVVSSPGYQHDELLQSGWVESKQCTLIMEEVILQYNTVFGHKNICSVFFD